MGRVDTLRLPGIGRLLQWRADGHWRELNDMQHEAEKDGSHIPGEDDWVRWSGAAQPQARGGEWGGGATWWLVYGELPTGATPEVELADGTRPPVPRVGRLWAAEWHSVAQPATVHVGAQRFDLPFFEPHYRRRESRAAAAGWFHAL